MPFRSAVATSAALAASSSPRALAQQVGGGAQGGVDGRAPGGPHPGRGGGGADRSVADGLVIGGHLGAHEGRLGGYPDIGRRPRTTHAPR